MFGGLLKRFGGKTPQTPPRRNGGDTSTTTSTSSTSAGAAVAAPFSSASTYATPLAASLASFDIWRSQLNALSDAVVAAEDAAESLSVALLNVAEAMAPLAGKAGEAPGAAAELLLSATAFASDTVPNFALALQALILRPLRAILTSHAELAARGSEHAEVVREYESAARDLASLQRRGGRSVAGAAAAKAAGVAARVAGGALGTTVAAAVTAASAAAGGNNSGITNGTNNTYNNTSSSTSSTTNNSNSNNNNNSTTKINVDVRARVVNRLVAAHALREALSDGLAAELRALEGRRKAVARNLLIGVASTVAAFGESTGSAFATCADIDLKEDAAVGGGGDHISSAAVTTSTTTIVTNTVSTPPSPTHARARLRILLAASVGVGGHGDSEATAWFDEGGASRALARTRAALARKNAREAVLGSLSRDVIVSSSSRTQSGGDESESACESILRGSDAAVWLPRLLRGLPLADVVRFACVSKNWHTAIAIPNIGARTILAWGGLIATTTTSSPLVVVTNVAEGRARLRFWQSRCIRSRGVAPPLLNITTLASTLSLALAEGAEGSKGARAPREVKRRRKIISGGAVLVGKDDGNETTGGGGGG